MSSQNGTTTESHDHIDHMGCALVPLISGCSESGVP